MGFWTQKIMVGNVEVTPLAILLGLVLVSILLVAVSATRRVLSDRVLPRVGLSRGASNAVATLAGYFVLIVGLLSILPIVFPGFNFGTISLIVGALSFGIGFGLRNIADNFVSGLILLIEQPIKAGDRIDLGGIHGEVIEIRARSTTVRTNDNIDIIVPNSEFLAKSVTNWSHNDQKIRFKIPVGVHYKSDVRLVEIALLEAAAAHPEVLKSPAPSVRFIQFGDSSLDFEVRVWTESLTSRPGVLFSGMNFHIWEAFQRHGIEIPYPQRDIYVKELPRDARHDG